MELFRRPEEPERLLLGSDGSGSGLRTLFETADLDLDLIAALRDALPVPLVLHGSSGVPDDTMRAAVRAGIVKINVGTAIPNCRNRNASRWWSEKGAKIR